MSKGLALPVSYITTDIDGVSRTGTLPGNAPSIGAYEFTPDINTPAPNAAIVTVAGNVHKISFNSLLIATVTFTAGTAPILSALYYPGQNPLSYFGNNIGNMHLDITATGGSGYIYGITLNYGLGQLGTIADGESNLRLAKYSDDIWTQYSILPNTITHTITVPDLNSFSSFALGDANSPQPVELSSFMSSVKGRDVKLQWTTASEQNNEGFEIQKSIVSSKDPLDWVKAGYLTGNGTKTTHTNYTFEDKKLNTGNYNYRLKQIDYNGNFEYHNLASVIEIGVPGKYDISQNYPNPFNPTSKIDFDLPYDSKVSIKLYDINGREMMTLVNEQKPIGYYTIQINGSNLSSGVYFYRIIAEGKGHKFVLSKKLILFK